MGHRVFRGLAAWCLSSQSHTGPLRPVTDTPAGVRDRVTGLGVIYFDCCENEITACSDSCWARGQLSFETSASCPFDRVAFARRKVPVVREPHLKHQDVPKMKFPSAAP
jgi:hypothetical protein